MKKIVTYSWLLALPMMVIASVVWNASATPDGKCPNVDPPKDDVLLANMDDCNSFYACRNGVAILMHCPDGLHFNAKLRVCDWPHTAGCTISLYDCYADFDLTYNRIAIYVSCTRGSGYGNEYYECSSLVNHFPIEAAIPYQCYHVNPPKNN